MAITLTDETIEAVIKAKLHYLLWDESIVNAIYDHKGSIAGVLEEWNDLELLKHTLNRGNK